MARTAAMAPSTPTVPSYMPDLGIASQCDPESIVSGVSPASFPKTLPISSSLHRH